VGSNPTPRIIIEDVFSKMRFFLETCNRVFNIKRVSLGTSGNVTVAEPYGKGTSIANQWLICQIKLHILSFSVFSTKMIVLMMLKMILTEITAAIITMPSRKCGTNFAPSSRLIIIKIPRRSWLLLWFSHSKKYFLIYRSVNKRANTQTLHLSLTCVPNFRLPL
jgi:hypothetical protein